jgi:hypothetical protein
MVTRIARAVEEVLVRVCVPEKRTVPMPEVASDPVKVFAVIVRFVPVLGLVTVTALTSGRSTKLNPAFGTGPLTAKLGLIKHHDKDPVQAVEIVGLMLKSQRK